ncbi:MAG: FtsH protease activity modulator HflK, partial [Dongiaceae bacterium]
ATGDANRFLAVYEEYKQAKSITERRIYLETMEEIMQKMRKVLIDTGSGSGAVPYLPLDQLLRQQAPSAPTQSPGSAGASQ